MNSYGSLTERIASLKAAHPLSSIIGEYVDLKRCGRELRGCCPFHQERTPSFYVNDEKGTYHCFGCGAGGDHINFVKELMNMSTIEALDYCGGSMPQIPYSAVYAPEDRGDRSEYAQAIWERCVPIDGTPAEAYLNKRAIETGYHDEIESLRYGELPFEGSGKYPALVAAVTDLQGKIQGIQRIYLTSDGDKMGPGCKRTLGLLRGGAVKFEGPDGPSPAHQLFLTEGIEDALSIAQIMGSATVWATLGTSNLANVRLPDECTDIVIAHDNDEAGRNAANEAAGRFASLGRRVSLQPPSELKDWNAHLQFWDSPDRISYYNELPWRMCLDQTYEYGGLDEYDMMDASFRDGGKFCD